MEPGTGSPGGATTRHEADIDPAIALDHVGEAVERRLHGVDIFLARALLRAEDAGDTPGACQHVLDVAGDLHRHPGEPRVPAGEVDAVEFGEPEAAARDVRPTPVEKTHAQGLCQTGATVVHAGIPAPYDDPRGPGVERGQDEFPDAAGRRPHWVAPVTGHVAQPGRGGELDDRRAAVGAAEHGERSVQGLSEWPRHPCRTELAARHPRERRGRALATVNESEFADLHGV